MKILSFGEILWDVYPNEKYIGGAPLNFAAHFVKQGGFAYMLSSIGDDELGRDALKKLHNWKINTEYVDIIPHKQTGKCLVSLNENGVPTYNLLDDVAYDYINCDLNNKYFDALYFGTLALRRDNNIDSVSKIIENNTFKEIFVDINIRSPYYSKKSILFALKHATIIKISDEELPIVMNETFCENHDFLACAKLLSKKFNNIKLLIITMGEKGSFAYNCKEEKAYTIDALKVNVVSTVGAGDSFSASFMYNYLLGKSIDECLFCANKLSAFVVSKADAIPEYDSI